MGVIQQPEEEVPGTLTQAQRHEIEAIVSNSRTTADALEECNTVAEVAEVLKRSAATAAGISDSGLHAAVAALSTADSGEGAKG